MDGVVTIYDLNELLNILIENTKSIIEINKHLKSKTGVFIKIDTGYHRTGIEPASVDRIEELTDLISASEKLIFKGFLSHYGNTYNAHSRDEIKDIYLQSTEKLLVLKAKFIKRFPEIIISIGDTPSCSIVSDFAGIDEIRPGNFVFYDSMQYLLGSCSISDIAICLACPVVAKHELRQEIVVHGGAVHLSHDSAIHPSGF